MDACSIVIFGLIGLACAAVMALLDARAGRAASREHMQMNWRCRSLPGCLLVLVTLGLLTACPGGALDIPHQPVNYVVDLANLVDAQTESRLNDYLHTLETKTTAQVVVLTIPSLQGRTLEVLSLDIAYNRWKLGQQGKDNGVLLLVAAQDRKYRFEVGYGLESVLPDSVVGRIGREHLVPHFRQGNHARGLELATVAVATAIAKHAGVQLEGMPPVRGPHAVAGFRQPYDFPPPLPSGSFLHDAANLLRINDRAPLVALQKRIYAQTESPLVLVTIKRMSDFTSHPSEIDAFARAWFNHWAIGFEENHTGILLLVSHGDRQAWIELGAGWGHRWDRYRELITEGMMIPALKKGDDVGGILAGVHALADMAVRGPQGVVPSVGIVAKLMTIPLVQRIQGYQSLSPFWGLLTLALGVLSLVLAAVLRSRRGGLLLTGALLLLAGLMPILLAAVPIAVIACFMRISRSPFYHTDTATNLRYSPASYHLGVGGGGFSGGGFSGGGGGSAGGGGGGGGGGGASGGW